MNITIIGAGTIGTQLAIKFAYEKHSITIIENDKKKASIARDSIDAFVVDGSGSSIKTLEQSQIKSADALISLTHNDELNIFACQLAKKYGVRSTVARVRNQEFLEKNYLLNAKELGVDFIIHPEIETAKAIIRLIKQSSSTDILEFDEGKVQFIGVRLDSNTSILKVPLKELGERFGNPAIRLLAIKRRQFTIIPTGEDFLIKGDQVFFICDKVYLKDAMRLFGKENVSIKDIMIIGGGQIGGYIARSLESDLNIKIIENNIEKAENLSSELDSTLLINGDGSDLDLLVKENLREMDEFIAVTGNDETNIITSIIARHLEVPRTITLIGKNEYLPLSPTLGLDSVVSKQQITVNAIERFIRRQKVANLAEIPGLDAEIIEFFATSKSRITKKPLKDIGFPKGAIIGAIVNQHHQLTVPKGDTQINPGDKVTVFSLPKAVKSVEKLF